MTVAQGLGTIIVFWAIVGGLGAPLLLPAMQSLIFRMMRLPDVSSSTPPGPVETCG
jgi:hypothetical protein